LLVDALAKILIRDPEWRQFIPLAPVATLPAFGLPPAIEQFFAARLEQLRLRVGAITPAEVGIQWRTDLAGVPSNTPPAELKIEIAPPDVLRVVEPAGLVENPGNQTVAFFAGRARVELPEGNRAFLRHIIERKEFVARDAARFCDPDEELD